MRTSKRTPRAPSPLRSLTADLPIEFVSQHVTSYGGLELLRRYFRLLGLHRRIRQATTAPAGWCSG